MYGSSPSHQQFEELEELEATCASSQVELLIQNEVRRLAIASTGDLIANFTGKAADTLADGIITVVLIERNSKYPWSLIAMEAQR